MSCGNKKQTKESGVHLTERTCSPYNPIIRQIVDDCLGLPVYPVTSIDAVIDEEGNTLRKLLQNLLDQIKSGNTDVSAQIELILQAIEELQNNSANDEDFQELKNLVKAIASKTDIGTPNLPTVVPNTNTPIIVNIINKILEYLGIDPANPGNSMSVADILDLLISLVADIANLNIRASANQYTELGVNQNGPDPSIPIIAKVLGLVNFIGIPEIWNGDTLHERVLALEEGGDVSERIDVLERTVGTCDPEREEYPDLCTRMGEAEGAIQDIIESLGDGEGNGTIINRINILEEQVGECRPRDPGDPNLCLRVGAIENKIGDCAETDSICTLISNINDDIDEIKANLGDDDSEDTVLNRLKSLETNSAHLDPEVLKLMPENCLNPEIYQTLKIGEYPPTLIDVLTENTERRNNVAHLEYAGLLKGQVLPGEISDERFKVADLYPLGHADSSCGRPLFLKKVVNEQIQYVPLLSSDGVTQLRCGNNKITISDLNLLHTLIIHNKKLANLLEPTQEQNINYEDIFIQVSNGVYKILGDVNLDGGVNDSDNNQIVDLIIRIKNSVNNSKPTHTLPSVYSDSYENGWLLYYDNLGQLKAIYPCIEGKIYLDYFTGNLYCYIQGEMKPVMANPAHTEAHPYEEDDVADKVLMAEEYPQQSVVVNYNAVADNSYPLDGFIFFGDAGRLKDNNIYASLIPFGYKENSTYYNSDYSYKLYKYNGSTYDPVNVGTELAPEYVYAGSGTVQSSDLTAYQDMLLQNKYPEAEIVSINGSYTPSGTKLYYEYNGHHYEIGNCAQEENFDLTGGKAAAIDAALRGTGNLITDEDLANNVFVNYPTDKWLYGYKNEKLYSFYPCIEGRIYNEKNFNKLYVYKNGAMEEVTAIGGSTRNAIDRANYVNGGIGQLADAIDHINPKYGNTSFEWTLLDADNEFSKMIRFVPSPATLAYYTNPNIEPDNSDDLGTFIDITNGDTVRTVSYGDIR